MKLKTARKRRQVTFKSHFGLTRYHGKEIGRFQTVRTLFFWSNSARNDGEMGNGIWLNIDLKMEDNPLCFNVLKVRCSADSVHISPYD